MPLPPVAPSPPPPPALRPRPAGLLIGVLVGVLVGALVLLAVVVSGDNVVTRTDASVVDWMAQHRPGWLVDAAEAVTLLGHGAILAVLLIAVCAGLVWRGVLPPRAALLPPIALAFGGGLNPLMKSVVDRPRPPVELRAVVEHSSGFPSGHSTQAACAWITLGLVLWLWGRGRPRRPLVAAVALVAAIGITRVILAVHSPTDVLAGWCWGTAMALTVVGAAAYAERSSAARNPGSASASPDLRDPAAGRAAGASMSAAAPSAKER